MKKSKGTIGFWGCGNMGSAILKGMLSSKYCSPRSVYIYDTKKIAHFSQCKRVSSVADLAAKSDVILLGIKPQGINEVKEIVSQACFKNTCIVSILAGITISKLQSVFGRTAHIVRTMPNLGLTVGVGATGITKGKYATKKDLTIVEAIFGCSGITVTVQEKHIDTITAVSGSGPAYFFYLTELLVQAGVKNGLKRKDALSLATYTALGAAKLQIEGDCDPQEWRKRVTSPGGTTEAAFKKLLTAKYTDLFYGAINNAIKRAGVLSKM